MKRTPYWYDVVERALAQRERGVSVVFGPAERVCAAGWVTCACGQQDARIPRNEAGAPIDRILRDLGLEFSSCVSRQNPRRAKAILDKIEARSAEILRAFEPVVEAPRRVFTEDEPAREHIRVGA